MLIFIEKCLGWIAVALILFILSKFGGTLVMWTGVALMFVVSVLWEIRKIAKKRKKDEE